MNQAHDVETIQQPYLLVIGIVCYLDKQGNHYVDSLWYKDIAEHTKYIEHLTLASPCEYSDKLEGLIKLEDDPQCSNLRYCNLPSPHSFIQGLLYAPKTIFKLWKAIDQAAIVHSGLANWPIPLGWFSTPIALWKNKFQVIIVESAFWRISDKKSVTSWSRRMRANISESLNRWCVNHVDLPIFTSEDYKKSLLTDKSKKGYVIPATWIDNKNIISNELAQSLWSEKSKSTRLKILFAGRLIPDKGVLVLLEAIKRIAKKDLPVELDILGSGELLTECEKLAAILQGETKVKLLGTVPYNEQFFQLLQKYEALIIPALSDEQPRIVYDAHSQGVTVIASNTTGNRQCIEDQKTGIFFEVNDSEALEKKIEWALSHRNDLRRMGMDALTSVSNMTHDQMHAKRWSILLEALSHERDL